MPNLKKKLTVRSINSIKAGPKDIFVWDTEIPGFGLRVWPSGKKSFIYQYRNKHGRTRRPVIGQFNIVRPEQARRKALKWAADVQDGGDPSEKKQETRRADTFATFAERYMSEHARAKKKPRSVKGDESNLRNHALPALGNKKVAAITRADVSKLHYSMRDMPVTANRVLALLSKMFNLAERWGVRPDGSNPCRHVDRYPEKKLERFLSGDEMARLGQALNEAERTQTELPSAVAAIRLLIFTGCRLSEILSLRWDEGQVDFEQRCLRLPDSKTGAKLVHLSAPALEVLNGINRHEGNPYVIVGRNKESHLVNLRKPWYRIRKLAGLEDLRMHDLRHSFASVAAARGLSLPIIGALLGHSQPATTQRYAHLASDPLKQATDLIGAHIDAAMKGGKSEVVDLEARRK